MIMRLDVALRAVIPLLVALSPAASMAQSPPANEDGYDLWLRYRLVTDATRRAEYRAAATEIVVGGNSATVRAARGEILRGVFGLLGKTLRTTTSVAHDGAIVV